MMQQRGLTIEGPVRRYGRKDLTSPETFVQLVAVPLVQPVARARGFGKTR